MIKIVINHQGVRELVIHLAGVEADPDCPCIGTVRDGVPAGGFVFTNYLGDSIQCHMGGVDRHWLTRDLTLMFFDYAFNQLGVKKLIAPVSSTNRVAIAMDLRAGFSEECRIKQALPGADLLFLTMTREQCRFLGLPMRGFTPGSNPAHGGYDGQKE